MREHRINSPNEKWAPQQTSELFFMSFYDPQGAISMVRGHLYWRQSRSLDLCSFLSEIFSYCWESKKCFNQFFLNLKINFYFFVFSNLTKSFEHFFFVSMVFPHKSLWIHLSEKGFRYVGSNVPPVYASHLDSDKLFRDAD